VSQIFERLNSYKKEILIIGIVGFVPNPESAKMVVDWVQALAEEDEETKFFAWRLDLMGGPKKPF
jgi:pyridoxal/pyridoxine/pyridoxamine kinase